MNTNTDLAQPKRILLKDYQPPAFSTSQIHLSFNLHEQKTTVKARIQFKKLSPAPLVLNGKNLKLQSLKINDETLTANQFEISNESLTINEVPNEFTLESVVEINPEANKACEGLYVSNGIFATQCEAEGFRSITYFLDRPDVMTIYTVEIEADRKKCPYLLSNGDLISKKDLGNGRHQATWKDPFKKPSYLFALVAGDMGVIEDHFTTKSGKKVKLEVFATHGKQTRCLHAMASLKKSMTWDEERFGLEYDLNQFMIVSIDDFNMGAMENKGLNIFNSRLVLADVTSATDDDFDSIEAVVGHEYFHNWTGNRVTCRNWFELSLKEGLTVFRDQEFTADLHSHAVERIKAVDTLRSKQFAEDAGPNAHPVRPESCLSVDNFYTPTIYEKGAEVIRMMQTIVGREGFRRGMDEYFKRHDGQAVTILDFASAISEANKTDFTQFKLWYAQAGTPTVEVQENYDATKKEYTLTLSQSLAPTEKQPQPLPFHIPLLIGLIDSKGREFKIDQPLLHLTMSRQAFRFTNIAEKPVLSINRQFSAPIKLVWNASQEELLHLITYDSDEFNRREAGYKMILQEIRRLIYVAKSGQELKANDQIVAAFGSILRDGQIDAEFKALMLELPPDNVLAQEENTLDAVAFEKAYDCFYRAFVSRYESDLLAVYRNEKLSASAGGRALKNRLLNILVDGKSTEGPALAAKQFSGTDNMTEKLGALAVLCKTEAPEKYLALESFFNQWNADPVVYNKWLQVQAHSNVPGTFAHLKKLSETKPFSFEVPNNVYSLLRVLGENFLVMSEESGAPYAWLCEQALAIDAKNPQVAARVFSCGCFNFVKKLPAPLKEKAQAQIKRVLTSNSLSRNSRELLEGCI